MDKASDGAARGGSDWFITIALVACITLSSVILMLRCASPEPSWDEADYIGAAKNPWTFLWRQSDYGRHNHGPMGIFLAKLGLQFLPPAIGTFEMRARFGNAVAGSLGIGLLYWMLRHLFKTSRAAALVASGLLLMSVIRLQETSVVGPHQLMLVCTLLLMGLGFHWRDRPTLQAAIGIGLVLGFGISSMTYAIPAGICWAIAVWLAGKGWLAWERPWFKFSWLIAILLITVGITALIMWPPNVLKMNALLDFKYYVRYPHHATLVGDRIFEITPRWAMLYWLAQLDAPILIACASIITIAFWKAYRQNRLSSRHVYLAVFLGFCLLNALAAHMAGARNVLQFEGVACFVAAALFDEAMEFNPRYVTGGAVVILIAAAANLVGHVRAAHYIPYIATDGYRAFLKENHDRLKEKAPALVYGWTILDLYAGRPETGAPIAWNYSEIPWTTDPKYAAIPPGIKYV
jgi:hypothetical protein